MIGKLLRLEPLKSSDASDLLLHTGNDAELWKWLPYKSPLLLSDMQEIVAKILADVNSGNREAFAIFATGLNQVIGVTCFLDLRPEQSGIEVGSTFIGRKFWRTSVNSEAKLLMLTEAFEVRDSERVTLKTDNLNLRSQEAIERLGAQREGVLRHHVKRLDGSWRDSVYYSILKSEWPGIKARLK